MATNSRVVSATLINLSEKARCILPVHVSYKPLLALIFEWELDYKEKAPHTFAVCSFAPGHVSDQHVL